MPDSSITAPVVADPIDRLTLGASDARDESCSAAILAFCACDINQTCGCMAEE